ncbi:unnamed protein product [Meganyctiphanes norvegica]|uniref:Uncharacterized protein n=1 Tax=Meganyctiphanes norvegica TaxID=48144 RepID=A0AAV2QJ26_MEGNR
MVPGRDLTRVRSISSWALLLISCVLCVAEKRLDIDSMRSLVQRRAGSPLLTNWLSNVINEEGLPNVVHEERPHWISKSEGKYHKNNEEDEEGLIIFNSIRGYMENNNSMVELEIHGERTFVVNNLTFTYNGGEEKMELSSPWTGDSEAFIFEADIFDYEDIELSLVGRNGDMQSPVTARGSVSFQFGGWYIHL